jgi:SAM-dependent methyltransferase
MNTIFFLIGLAIFAILAGLTFYSFFIGAPYFKTPKKAIREIFGLAQIKPGQKLYDLGAGDGKALIIAEKEFGAKAVGFELAPIIYAMARLNLFFHGIKKVRLYCKNFYNQDLSDADIVFCFLSIHAMARLEPKFKKELRPGAKIISYSFSLHGWTPKKVIEGYPGKVFLYEV